MPDTGWLNPGSVSEDLVSGGVAWSNVTNFASDDGSLATCSFSGFNNSRYVIATNYGAAVPTDRVIQGIEWRVKCEATPADIASFDYVKLRKMAGDVGDDKALPFTMIGNPEQTITRGGAADLWGTTWTVSEVNASTFGCRFRFHSDGVTILGGDAVEVKIYYSDANSEGVADFTFGTMTVAGEGAGPIDGEAAITFGTMTVAGEGSGPIEGTAAITFGTMTVAGEGAGPIDGEAAITFGTMTVAGEGTAEVAGEAAITFGTMTVAGEGAGPIDGEAAITFGAMITGGGEGYLLEWSGSVWPEVGTLPDGLTISLTSMLSALNWARQPGGLLNGAEIRLFTNNFVPDPETTLLGDFVDATFPGYAPFQPIVWGVPYVDSRGRVRVDGGSVSWSATGPSTETVYGWYIISGPAGGGQWVAAYRLPDPVPILLVGDGLAVLPTYSTYSMG